MAYCKYCGEKLKPKDNFCEHCGKSIKSQVIGNLRNKKRPTFLKIWLIILLVISTFSLLIILLGLLRIIPFESSTNVPVILILAITNIICLISIWKWKRWGFYGYIVVQAFTLILSFYFEENITPLIAPLAILESLIFIFILYFAMRPVWEDFD